MTQIDYSKFPFKVYLEGYSGGGEDLSSFELKSHDWFGYKHGDCIFDEYNCHAGKCSVTGYSQECHHVTEEYLRVYGDFWYYDKDGHAHIASPEPVGEFCTLFDLDHCHIGIWTVEYLRKIGYDYHQVAYHFKNKTDAQLFLLLIKTDSNKAHLMTEKEYLKLKKAK